MALEWDDIRWYIALFAILTGPGMVFFWVPFHGLRSVWRRTGMGWAYLVSFGAYTGLAVGAWSERDRLLSWDLGANAWTTCLGAALLIGGFALRRTWARKLPVQALLGLSEIAPERFGTRLLTQGAYARIRHPRYLDLFISLCGQAFLSNFAGAYAACGVVAMLLPLVIFLEERELMERFGGLYVAYREQIPALLPRRL